MLIRVLMFAAIGAVIAVVVQYLKNRGPRRLFVIRIREDHVKLDGHVPTRAHSEVIDFIDELRLTPGAIIYGVELGKTDFAVRANATVPDDKLERLREFLKKR